MFGKQVTLFRLAGFAVRADLSWLLIVVLLTWSLASSVFPALYPGRDPRIYWVMAAAGALIFFLSIVLHELAHSLVARRYGVPISGITLFVFGGVAEMTDEPPNARAELLMAAAGPATSLALALFCIGGAFIGEMAGWQGSVLTILTYVGTANLVLAVFNMLPAFPLDGGRMLRAALWWRWGNLRRATRVAAKSGQIAGWTLTFLGAVWIISGDIIGGLWWLLIGTFLRMAATGGYQQIVVRQLLEGQPVRKFMNPEPVTVPRHVSVAELVEDYIYRFHHSTYPVTESDRVIGCVSVKDVKKLPREQWDQQTVGSITQRCSDSNMISAEADAMLALRRMIANRGSQLMVVENGRLVGILSLKDLFRFLGVRLDLEGSSSHSGEP